MDLLGTYRVTGISRWYIAHNSHLYVYTGLDVRPSCYRSYPIQGYIIPKLQWHVNQLGKKESEM